ncbi:MAG: hypothetical protein ABW189_03725 [Rickettsiales bacterium]
MALRELDVFLALLNLVESHGRHTIILSGGKELPLRRFSCGKHFILYDRQKKRQEDSWHSTDGLIIEQGKIFSEAKFMPIFETARNFGIANLALI